MSNPNEIPPINPTGNPPVILPNNQTLLIDPVPTTGDQGKEVKPVVNVEAPPAKPVGPPENPCTITKTCKTIILTSEGKFCSCCYEICKGGPNQPKIESVIFDVEEGCTCFHEENDDFFKSIIKEHYKAFSKMPFRKFMNLNLFFMHKKNGFSFFELVDKEAAELIAKDYEALLKKSFRWADIEIPSIDQRISLLEVLNQVMPRIAKTVIFTKWVDEHLPVKFVDMITDFPDYSFGHPLYLKSQIFYTHLIEIFGRLHLEKDFETLDKIDAQDMGTYTPIARHFIREKNIRIPMIRKKYFNEEFNLHRFTMKLVDKFIPGATWRWIEDKHKLHIHAVKWCKILMEYSLINDDEIEEIFLALYLKIQTFKFLEVSVDGESGKVDEKVLTAWSDGLKAIREYYCEIFVLYLFRKQDNLLISMFKKAYLAKRRLNFEELRNIFNFNQSILFEEEFARKMMDVLFSYILSQNTINKKVIISRKIEDMVTNLMYNISNTNDLFLEGIKLIKEDDYFDLCKELCGEVPPSDFLMNDFNGFYEELQNIKVNSTNGLYLYKEGNVIKDLISVLDKIDQKTGFMKAIENKEPRNYQIQRVIFQSNVHLNLQIIMSNYIEYSNHFVENNSEELFHKFTNFFRYYLNKNTECHCSYFVEVGYWSVENMFYKFPDKIAPMVYGIMDDYPNVVLTKEYLLDVTHDMFTKYLETVKKEPTVKGWKTMSIVTDIVKIFTRVEFLKIFHWIPEYDVRIMMEMMNLEDMRNFNEYERLLKERKNDIENVDDAKLEFYMNFLNLIFESGSYRYVQSSLKKMHASFSAEKMINLVPLAGDDIKYRSTIFDVYSIFHIDFKNHLINNRSDYYHVRPKDMQYEEDPYVDHFYDKSIDLFINEIEYLIKRFEEKNEKPFDESQYFYYFNSSLFGSIVKLMNYYLVIRENDLEKINKYIPNLEKLCEFLYKNRMKILTIFGVENEELESPTKNKMEMELAKIDMKFKLKREKLQVVGLSRTILEICEKIMIHKPLVPIKKKLLSKKPSNDRCKNVFIYYETFATTLSTKIKHLDLPFMNINNGKAKNSNGEIPILAYAAAFYEEYKMKKMSIDAKSNIYLASLNENRQESKNMCYNLCCFIHNQLKKDWYIDKKNPVFTLLEAFCNFLFISTNSVQENFYKVLLTQPQNEQLTMMNACWSEMKWYQSFIKFKTNIDKIWKETYKRVLLLIKFHQFLCEDNFKEFKTFFAEKVLKADSIDRTQRWTTIFQKLSDNFQWHYNYEKGEISDFDSTHRQHLFTMATGVFENLAELCTGPHKVNQKKVFSFIFDRYTGFMRRYCRDHNNEFYKTKLALFEFFMTLIEGLDPEIVSYQVTNLELSGLNSIMINSLKQAYYCIIKKDPFDKKKMSEYNLKMEDYVPIMDAYRSNEEFSTHTLISIALKIFTYIKTMAEAKSKYDIFSTERNAMLEHYKKYKTISDKSITEEDLVTYKFVRRILIRIEIKLNDETKLTPYYFPRLSGSFFLSESSKERFLNTVDRSSIDSKLSGFINYTQYFQIEMAVNQNRFKNHVSIYKKLSTANVFQYIEAFVMLLSVANNMLLLTSFSNNNPNKNEFGPVTFALAYLEIIFSAISLIMNFLMTYPSTRATTRQIYQDTHAEKKDLGLFDKFYSDYYLALFSKNFIVNCYHIIFVSLGITTSVAFLSIDILAIVSLFPTMIYIIRSVTEHINQLFLTLVLAGVIMFAYSIFIQLYFISDLADGTLCSTLSHCYFTIIDKAFRAGDGIGSMLGMGYYGMANQAEGGDPKFYGILFVNLSFFLFINIVLLNIILAILVDTFSGLREKSETFEEDSERKCFICNIEKYNFEKAGINFEKHCNLEHNVWDYTNFVIMMRGKTEKDCTGIEDEIFKKLKKGEMSWLPIKRSSSYEKQFPYQTEANFEELMNIAKEAQEKLKEVIKVVQGAM